MEKKKKLYHWILFLKFLESQLWSRYSRMNEVKLVEDSHWSFMVCLGRPCHFKFFKGFLPQILLGSFLNTVVHIYATYNWGQYLKLKDVCEYKLLIYHKWPGGLFIYYNRKIFQTASISYPQIRTRSCAYQRVRNVSISETFANAINKGFPNNFGL